MKRGNSSPRVVRQRKMKILLSAVAEVPEADYEGVNFDTGRFVTICQHNWPEWLKHAIMEREKTLEMVSQYPTSSNIGALLDIEALVNKMTSVRLNNSMCIAQPFQPTPLLHRHSC